MAFLDAIQGRLDHNSGAADAKSCRTSFAETGRHPSQQFLLPPACHLAQEVNPAFDLVCEEERLVGTGVRAIEPWPNSLQILP